MEVRWSHKYSKSLNTIVYAETENTNLVDSSVSDYNRDNRTRWTGRV